MSTRVASPSPSSEWSWLHVSGLSGSFSLHAVAILLLAIPVAAPMLKPQVEIAHASIINEPPLLPVVPLPPEPMPPKQIRRTVVASIPVVPVVNEASDMAIPLDPAPTIPEDNSSTVTATDTQSSVLNNVSLGYETVIQPDYPRDARRRGDEGTVVLSVLVGRDGLPKEVVIARSSGHRQLDREARAAVMRWRFRPVQVNGVTVEARGLVPIEFDLSRL